MIQEIRNKIVEISNTYVGIKEIGNNEDFTNHFVKHELEGVGWQEGWAYCALTGKLIWCKAYGHFDSSIITELNKLFNPSAVKTFRNFQKSKKFRTYTNQNFEKGDLIIWQKYINGKPDWRGHLGIVISPEQLFVKTFEGNTNEQGSRTGNGFYLKDRGYDFYKDNGLRLIGGVKPCEV